MKIYEDPVDKSAKPQKQDEVISESAENVEQKAESHIDAEAYRLMVQGMSLSRGIGIFICVLLSMNRGCIIT